MRVDWYHYLLPHALTSKKPSECRVTTQDECFSPSPWGMCTSVWTSQGNTKVIWRLSCSHHSAYTLVHVLGKALKPCLWWGQWDAPSEVWRGAERIGDMLWGLNTQGQGETKEHCCTKPATCFTTVQPVTALMGVLGLSKAPGWKGARKRGGVPVGWRKWGLEEMSAWQCMSPVPCRTRPAQPHKFFQYFLIRLYSRREIVNGFYQHRSYSFMSVGCPARISGRASLCLWRDLWWTRWNVLRKYLK